MVVPFQSVLVREVRAPKHSRVANLQTKGSLLLRCQGHLNPVVDLMYIPLNR